jgi:REP element-mobilizing transposase RayT
MMARDSKPKTENVKLESHFYYFRTLCCRKHTNNQYKVTSLSKSLDKISEINYQLTTFTDGVIRASRSMRTGMSALPVFHSSLLSFVFFLISMLQSRRKGRGLQVRGWHSRGYLPHFDGGEISQFITFHLGDSMPQEVIGKWKRMLDHLPEEEVKLLLQRRIEAYLDQGYGSCYLKDERIATLVQNSFLYFDGERYRLSAWVVMPNHIHLLLTPIGEYTLSSIMHSLKGYTSSESNKILSRSGKFWQEDYFDRYIRDVDHFEKAVVYIENNPVKAGLCKHSNDWRFSSAYFRARTTSTD